MILDLDIGVVFLGLHGVSMRRMKASQQRSLKLSKKTERPSAPRDDAQAEDPWFLPAKDADAGPAPFGLRRERPLFDPVAWRAAEGALAADLAALCPDAGSGAAGGFVSRPQENGWRRRFRAPFAQARLKTLIKASSRRHAWALIAGKHTAKRSCRQ